MAKRRYEQRLRAEAANVTRRRIVDAAFDRLREEPSRPLSVDVVARNAGVSRSTVYLIFGSRAGLMEALGQELLHRSGYERLTEAVQHPDAREHLRGGLRAGAALFAANRDVARPLYSMALLDEETAGAAIRGWEDTRARGMRRLARRLKEQGLLREDLSVDDAAHVLWVLASFDSFDLLYTGRQLPVDRVADLLIEMAERTLYR